MKIRITDVKCAVIGDSPVVRLATDQGISGYGQVERYKPYLKWHVLHLREALLGEDPTDVERVMLKIRQRGGFKPWGSAVSAVEMALWDLAGKAAGLPVHKLLGGKVRDRVRVYNGAVRFPMTSYGPADYAANMAQMKARPEGSRSSSRASPSTPRCRGRCRISSTATRRRSRSTATSSAAC
jgi:L-alanine-DL-glutamate epimerase-like enolase superfamily enzyme